MIPIAIAQASQFTVATQLRKHTKPLQYTPNILWSQSQMIVYTVRLTNLSDFPIFIQSKQAILGLLALI